jgi:cytochrome c biogenesis protein CcdA
MTWLASIFASFIAGVLSSFSPCVVAAVPIAVGFVGGQAQSRARAVHLSAAFVLGLTASFVVLGLAVARLGSYFGAVDPLWGLLLGVALTALGLWFWFSDAETCHTPRASKWRLRLAGSGALGALVLGAMTGAVMTPCATPALAAALVLAGSGSLYQASIWQGAVMLGAYGVGHGLLLFLAGVVPAVAQSFVEKIAGSDFAGASRRFFSAILVLAGIWLLISPLLD